MTVVELAKKVTIYDAIVNVQDGWGQLPPSTISKCFKTCGIFEGMFDAIPITNEDQTEEERVPNEFDHWFADLLEVPWDEYLAFDDQLENEAPNRAPTATSTEHIDRVPTAPGKMTTVFPVLEKYWNFIILLKILEKWE